MCSLSIYLQIFSALFPALGKTKEGSLPGICLIPVILILPMILGVDGIIYAQPIADLISAGTTLFMYLRLHNELNSQKSLILSCDN